MIFGALSLNSLTSISRKNGAGHQAAYCSLNLLAQQIEVCVFSGLFVASGIAKNGDSDLQMVLKSSFSAWSFLQQDTNDF